MTVNRLVEPTKRRLVFGTGHDSITQTDRLFVTRWNLR
jgi:hypothetical protein